MTQYVPTHQGSEGIEAALELGLDSLYATIPPFAKELTEAIVVPHFLAGAVVKVAYDAVQVLPAEQVTPLAAAGVGLCLVLTAKKFYGFVDRVTTAAIKGTQERQAERELDAAFAEPIGNISIETLVDDTMPSTLPAPEVGQ